MVNCDCVETAAKINFAPKVELQRGINLFEKPRTFIPNK